MQQKCIVWVLALCGGACLAVGAAWAGYIWGYRQGEALGHRAEVATAQGEAQDKTSLMAPRISLFVAQRESIRDDGQIICTVHVTKRALNGLLLEGSTEATAGPCTGRQR